MSGAVGLAPALIGAVAGGLLALALREALLASPAAARWLRLALTPRRAVLKDAPSTLERRRLAALGAAAAVFAGWLLAGPTLVLPLSVAGPALMAWAISSRRRRYRAAVERALPEVATAVADSLSAGRSLRASLPAAAASLDGPPASELARLGAELDLGAATTETVEAWRLADALGAGRRLRRRPAQPAARRRRPGRAAAPLRRRRGGARPGCRRRC